MAYNVEKKYNCKTETVYLTVISHFALEKPYAV